MRITVRAQLIVVILLTIAVVANAILIIYATHLNRQNFADLQKLYTVRDEKNIEWGQLQLEESTFAASSEIEKKARTLLEMRQPRADEIVMIRQ